MTPTNESATIWATVDRLLVHRKATGPRQLDVLDVLATEDQQAMPTPRRRMDILDVLADN